MAFFIELTGYQEGEAKTWVNIEHVKAFKQTEFGYTIVRFQDETRFEAQESMQEIHVQLPANTRVDWE